MEKKISEIYLNPDNPRNNNEAIEAVAKSIKEFGFNVPIVVNDDGMILAGNTRYKAAQKLGLDKVPVIVADNLTKEQQHAYILADNKTAEIAEWDLEKLNAQLEELQDIFNMEDFGFDFEELEKEMRELEEDKEIEEDDFDFDASLENKEAPRVKRGQIWKLGNHYLMCGDSTSKEDIERLMSADEKLRQK